MLESFPINPHDIVENFSCNSNEKDCKCCTYKSSVIDETLISNEESSEKKNYIFTAESHPMILVVSVTLYFTVGKLSNKESLNYKLMSHLTMRCICSKKF